MTHKTNKRVLTAEQEAARAARKERFNRLCEIIKGMSKDEKDAVVARAGAVVTVEGHPLSARNTIFCFYQRQGVTMVGGFRQWLSKGRCVRKGEHGMSILVPCGGGGKLDGGADGSGSVDSEKVWFVSGTVFDVSQTELFPVVEPVATVTPEIAAAFGMGALPNVRVVEAERSELVLA